MADTFLSLFSTITAALAPVPPAAAVASVLIPPSAVGRAIVAVGDPPSAIDRVANQIHPDAMQTGPRDAALHADHPRPLHLRIAPDQEAEQAYRHQWIVDTDRTNSISISTDIKKELRKEDITNSLFSSYIYIQCIQSSIQCVNSNESSRNDGVFLLQINKIIWEWMREFWSGLVLLRRS